MIRVPVGYPESTKFINLIPPTAVAWLLQYSGSRVEHRMGFLHVGDLIGRFVLCKMCTPICASARVASSNIMLSEYRSHGELCY